MNGQKLGRMAQEMTDEACAWYRARGLALVTFAGPEWVGVRPMPGKPGHFTGIQKRGPVDYVGHSNTGLGFRFDVKATTGAVSIDLGVAKVPPHQVEELRWCHRFNVPAGLLVARVDKVLSRIAQWYWLPAGFLLSEDGFADGKWCSIKWRRLDELSMQLPSIDSTGQVPDFLGRVLGE